jgi:hypothetical protein
MGKYRVAHVSHALICYPFEWWVVSVGSQWLIEMTEVDELRALIMRFFSLREVVLCLVEVIVIIRGEETMRL